MQLLVALTDTKISRLLINVKMRQKILDWNIVEIGIQEKTVGYVTIAGAVRILQEVKLPV